MPHGTITYGQEKISFNVLYGARKTMAIEVFPDRSVVIKAPVGRTPARQFVGGETHLYLGRQFRLKISTGSHDSVKLSRGYFLIETKDSVESDKIRFLLERWYADKAKSTFIDSFSRCWPYFEKLEMEKPRLQIRRMKKRWGSLSPGGLLTLNPALIRAPRECIDYVITHELCHLQCHDHSSDFYRLLERVMPDWEKRKHKLELALV